MDEPRISPRSYVLAYAALLVLLLTNIGIGFFNLGWGNVFISLAIAIVQAAVIALFLMHGLFEKALVRLIIGGALLWFMILITLTMNDYITRNWLPIAGK